MNNKLVNLTYFGAVITISSATYQVYYWTKFDIDIFQYITSSELLISGIGPIIIPTLLYVLISMINLIGLNKKFPYGGLADLKKELVDNPEDEKLKKSVISWGRKKSLMWALLLVPLILNVICYFYSYKIFYLILPYNLLGFSVFFTNILLAFEMIKGEFDIKLIQISLFMIIASFSYSNVNALEIIKREQFKYCKTSENEYDILLGKAGNHLFFQDLSGIKTKILNDNKIEKLELKIYDSRKLRTKEDSTINRIIKTHHNN
jgi:hypothetical protein